MNLQHTVVFLITYYPVLVYAVIILIGYVEGPILALLCGILYRLGYFHIIPIYFALMAGDLIGDCFWYWLGYKFGHRFVKRFGKYVSVTEDSIESVTEIFHDHKDIILITSKLTMGLGFALVTLFTAGLVKIPFRRYITLNAIGQFAWTGILLMVGYTFGHLYASFNNIFARVSFISLFLIVIVAMYGYGKFVRTKFSKRRKKA